MNMLSTILWTIYIGILGTGSVGLLISGKYKTFIAKLDFLISIFTWLGLFGYVTNRTIFHPGVWKIVFILGLLWDIGFSIFYHPEDEKMPMAARVLGLIVLIPLYYALYRYAFYK